VKLVDEPLRSQFPVRPNIPANTIMGFALGIIGGTAYVISTSRRQGMFG
jgi:capsular polysaccharide biosynthesis protein